MSFGKLKNLIANTQGIKVKIIEAYETENSKEFEVVESFDKLKIPKDLSEVVEKELKNFEDSGVFSNGENHIHLLRMNSNYVLRQGFDDTFVCNNSTQEYFISIADNMGLDAVCLKLVEFGESLISIENVRDRKIYYHPIDLDKINALKIYFHKTHKDAKIPEFAYSGTSAAFDLTVVEDCVINPGESKFIEHGINLTIDESEPYFMQFYCRSSAGIKKNLRCHPGIIDAGYTGPFKVYVHNLGTKPIKIERGERIIQVVLHKKHNFRFIELNDSEFAELETKQQRGSKGFGSSGK